jgi:S-(hydroxymethyl)glutathione dehydrogenase/alcohol dehydrogenase
MKTNAALLWETPGRWEVCEVELDEPGFGEVLVEMVATGLCHSDDHNATGDRPPPRLPYCAGHEGGGIVRSIGPGVTDLAEGDHIVTSFIAACGKCRWCAMGQQNLCGNGRAIGAGTQLDGTYRMHVDGRDVATGAMLGTFAQWQVYDQLSCVKIAPDVPLNVACLLACGVPTGWGSATNAADVQAGDTVMVIGSGGVGINAVQGAAHRGAAHVMVVDPQPHMREMALKLGATEAYADINEATDFARNITDGQGADSAIVTVGVVTGEHIAQGFRAVRKGGTVVVTGIGREGETTMPVIDLGELALYQKRIQGCLYGSSSPRRQIPALLDLYRVGILKLDELISQRYTLGQINEAYSDMHHGRNVRGVVDF